MLKCENCAYCWCDEDGEDRFRCHYEGPDRDAPCNWSEPVARYTVHINGERYDTDRWQDVADSIALDPEGVYVKDNVYDVTFSHGEWC